MVRVFDKKSINIGNVDPCFNNGSSHQDIVSPLDKVHQHRLQFHLRHLTVGISYPGLWHQSLDFHGPTLNSRHAIIEIEDLTFAC